MSPEKEPSQEDANAADTLPQPVPASDSAPDDIPQPSKPSPATEGPNPSKSKAVIKYIVIMFSVALLLILLSFLMQQRNHDALMQGISSSGLNAQTIVELELENAELSEALAQAQEQIEEANNSLLMARDLQTEAQQQRRAMNWLLTMYLYYYEGDLDKARALLEAFRSGPLPQLLPEASEIPDAPSPKALYDALTALLS